MKIHHADATRIVDNLNRVVEHQLQRNDHIMALKILGIALRDVWISSHEWKWEKRRAKLNKSVRRYNMESSVKDTIHNL